MSTEMLFIDASLSIYWKIFSLFHYSLFLSDRKANKRNLGSYVCVCVSVFYVAIWIAICLGVIYKTRLSFFPSHSSLVMFLPRNVTECAYRIFKDTITPKPKWSPKYICVCVCIDVTKWPIGAITQPIDVTPELYVLKTNNIDPLYAFFFLLID